MTETKFTKGPWTTVRDNHADLGTVETGRVVWSDKIGADVAYCPPVDGDNGNANARLIAAAPELYEVLKRVIALHAKYKGQEISPTHGEWLSVMSEAEVAIGKAE